MSSELLHLLFTVAGAVLGYYLKHQQQGETLPEAEELVRILSEHRKRRSAHKALAEISEAVQSASQPPPPPTPHT